jgi:hypothetical protein
VSAATYTCPVCGRSSPNRDADERYCGICQGLTSDPPPPGMRWVLFAPAVAALHFGRMLETRWLEPGVTYEILAGVGAGRYVYDGELFVPAELPPSGASGTVGA